MAKLILKTYPNANTEEQINVYRDGIKTILQDLHDAIEVAYPQVDLTEQSSKSERKSHAESVKAAGANDGIKRDLQRYLVADPVHKRELFTNARSDVQQYPALWSASSRPGASKIELRDPPDALSAYSVVHDDLTKKLRTKNLPKETKQKIQTALENLEKWQSETNAAYLARLRRETALDLKNSYALLTDNGLGNAELIKERDQILAEINRIESVDPSKLNTGADALRVVDQANALRKHALAFEEKLRKASVVAIREDLSVREALATQLSVITKREMDPYYENPKELSRWDKARSILKIATTTIGGLAGIGMFICLLIPGAQLGAIILGGIAVVALYPVIDSIGEVGRNLYYGRSPTKAQAIELGIVLPLLAGIMIGAHGLVGIGSLFVSKGAAILGKLAAASAIIAGKFTGAFNAVMNGLGSGFNSFLFNKSKTPKLEKNVSAHSIPLVAGLDLLHQKTPLHEKAHVMTKGSHLSQTWKGKCKSGYLYKGLKAGSLDKVHFEASHHHDIVNWSAGFFPPDKIASVQKAVDDYKKLAANSSIADRKTKLEAIETSLKHFDTHREEYTEKQKEKLAKLKDYVTSEITKLKQIEKEVEQEHTAYVVHH